MRVKIFDCQGRLVGPVDAAKVVKTDAEWSATYPGAIPRRPRQGHRAGLLRHVARQ